MYVVTYPANLSVDRRTILGRGDSINEALEEAAEMVYDHRSRSLSIQILRVAPVSRDKALKLLAPCPVPATVEISGGELLW